MTDISILGLLLIGYAANTIGVPLTNPVPKPTMAGLYILLFLVPGGLFLVAVLSLLMRWAAIALRGQGKP